MFCVRLSNRKLPVVLLTATIIAFSHSFKVCTLRMSISTIVEKNPIEAAMSSEQYRLSQTCVPQYKLSLASELVAMKESDVGRADNFYESTLSSLKRQRTALMQDKNSDISKRVALDENFYNLMNMGFDRRLASEANDKFAFRPHTNVAKNAALVTADAFELNKSKKEQIEAMKRTQLEQKRKVFKYIPTFLHKYVDYINSLRINGRPKDRATSLGITTFFAFVVWANIGARSAFMYYLVGNLLTMSMLLQRGQSQEKYIPGQPKNQPGTWSSASFLTAFALTLLFTIPSFVVVYVLTAVIPGFSTAARGKVAMISSLFTNSYMSSCFEVFEEKNKNGSRWKKAIKGYLEPTLETKIKDRILKKNFQDSCYLFAYDPEVDENPYKPKYLDELPGAAPLTDAGDLDEGESSNHFEKWRIERIKARRPALVEASSEDSWVGSKSGMFVPPPNWLSSAYSKGLKKLTPWRSAIPKYKKDVTEFTFTTGPFGFRDKHPTWLDLFNVEIWEEQLSVSRKLARAFGTYRKTMWKIDKDVQLKPCDGADKDKRKKR